MNHLVTTGAMAGAFEPCPAYRAPIEHDEPVCADCGHLADDHGDGRFATIVPIATRRRHPSHAGLPARKAS
jgi:hypothetical protein